MKFTSLQAVLGSAVVLLSLPACSANPGHRRLHLTPRKHSHLRASTEAHLGKRGSECAFPTDGGDLVAVTPDAENAGWAMSPDQPCLPGHYCPFACKPGMVMAQWDPDSTYTYPASMNGGLYCDKNGKVKKPFPGKPYCVEGTGAVKAVNKLGSHMSWCQTVLPGNEAMLIPTLVSSVATLAVPDTSYWQETAAHFYINPPGTDVDGCKWGDPSKPIGNWSPYVAGANTDGNGNTFVKIGMNPIWEDSGLKSNKPSFGVKIECDDGKCLGLPCEIAPGSARVSGGGTVGAGGAGFCVVTVPKGSSASIVAFGSGGGGGGSDSDSDSDSKPEPAHTSKAPDHAAFAAQPVKTTSAAPSSTSEEVTTSAEPTTTSVASTTLLTSTTSEDVTTTSGGTTTSTSIGVRPTLKAGIFHENSTSTAVSATGQPSKTFTPVVPTHTHKGEAGRHTGSAAAGLFIALAAAACLL
ncbi:putative secreted beta-glucosidase adg3 [Cladobotryum mycophilum]|uniref:Secreted beta-glucosidase adg3 n=1 Tax=Cladobotryum mycophilum TaxID=491253 RepID=A0ABR0T275_9HYPO